MTIETKHFDIAEYLNTPEEIRCFLQEVAATGDESDFIHALNTAARAMGMTEVAKKPGLPVQACTSQVPGRRWQPEFTTISKVTKALGCKLAIA